MTIHWPNGADVYFNPDKSPILTPDVVKALEYTLWIIRERTAIEFRYAGETNQRTVNGAIVLEFGDWDDFKEFPGYEDYTVFMGVRGIAARYGWPNQPYEYSRTLLNAAYCNQEKGFNRRTMRTLVHEMLHNAGVEHLSAPDAIMNKKLNSIYPVSYGLTCADYMAVQRGGNHSFVELNLHNDLWIPCVQGKMADLEYIGDGETHKWRLRSLRDAGPNQVESAVGEIDPEKPDLTLTDVRSPTMRLSLVKLDYSTTDEQWKLTHAE